MQKAQLGVTVLGATNLPNTDTFGKTDAYVKVIVANHPKAKTAVKNDTLSPVWDQAFAFELPLDPTGLPSGVVLFELYDQGTLKDTLVGSVTVNLALEHFARPGLPLELPITFTKSKWNTGGSFLRVMFSHVLAFQSLLLANPSGFGDQSQKRFYLDLKHIGPLALAIEYEAAALDVKLYITQPNTGLFADMVLPTQTNHVTKVRRREVEGGATYYGNMRFYEEVKLNDVPFWEDLNQLQIIVCSRKLEEEIVLDKVVPKHGWQGRMGWNEASTRLTNVELDRNKQEVYMQMPGSFLVIDFDKDNVDMKVAVLDIPENANMAFDLTLHGADVKKTSQVYKPSQMALGKHRIQRKLELDDVPYGTAFKDMVWRRYSLAPVWSATLASLVKLR